MIAHFLATIPPRTLCELPTGQDLENALDAHQQEPSSRIVDVRTGRPAHVDDDNRTVHGSRAG